MTSISNNSKDYNMKEILKVLEDATRMALLFMILKKGQVSVKQLRESLGLTGNAVYYHLKQLEAKNLVTMKKEPVESTNLNRKIYSFNKDFFSLKNDPEWNETIHKELKLAFMAEMYFAAASLMEGIFHFDKMTNKNFKQYYNEKNPICEVLFLKKEEYIHLLSIIKNEIQKYREEDPKKVLERSDGYVFSLFGYPPVEN